MFINSEFTWIMDNVHTKESPVYCHIDSFYLVYKNIRKLENNEINTALIGTCICLIWKIPMMNLFGIFLKIHLTNIHAIVFACTM